MRYRIDLQTEADRAIFTKLRDIGACAVGQLCTPPVLLIEFDRVVEVKKLQIFVWYHTRQTINVEIDFDDELWDRADMKEGRLLRLDVSIFKKELKAMFGTERVNRIIHECMSHEGSDSACEC